MLTTRSVVAIISAGPYNVLYAVAMLVAGAGAWRSGHRRNWPMLPWLTILATAAAFGIVGSSLISFDVLPLEPGEKTILGGVVLGAVGAIIAIRVLRFDPAAPDVLAPWVLGGLAIGRVGCFLVGCCFGRVTTLPWGVRYAVGTEAYAFQLARGLIRPGAVASLPVHPAQLYEAVSVLVLAACLCWRRDRAHGGNFLMSAVGLGLIRFTTEFFRAGPVTSSGLTVTQFTVAGAVLALVALGWTRGHPATRSVRPLAPLTPNEELRCSVLLVLIVIVTTGASGWLTPLETVMLVATAAPASIALLRRSRLDALRMPSGVLTVVVTLQVQQQPGGGYPLEYTEVGEGMMAGRYRESCGGVHDYAVTGVSISHTTETSPFDKQSLGARLFLGFDRSQVPNTRLPQYVTMDVRGANLEWTRDGHYAGVAVGVHVGDLVRDGKAASVYPALGLRLGPLSGPFVEGRLFDHAPSALPAPTVQIGVGTGLGPPGWIARAGVSDAGVYGSATILGRQGLTFEPFLAYGGSEAFQVGGTLRVRLR